MENIKVTECTDGETKFGKPMKYLTVENEAGKEYKTNIFSNFVDFANVKVGYVIRGKLAQNGKYTEIQTEVSPTAYKPKGNPNFRSQQIEKVMDKKAGQIHEAQDNKEWSIKVASTMNKGVDLAIAEFTKNPNSLLRLEEEVLRMRKFIWDNWDVDVKDTDAITGELLK